MENPEKALEDARQAGIDLDLLDCNLALSVEARLKLHDAALPRIAAYEEREGLRFTEEAILRRGRSGVEFLLKVQSGYIARQLA